MKTSTRLVVGNRLVRAPALGGEAVGSHFLGNEVVARAFGALGRQRQVDGIRTRGIGVADDFDGTLWVFDQHRGQPFQQLGCRALQVGTAQAKRHVRCNIEFDTAFCGLGDFETQGGKVVAQFAGLAVHASRLRGGHWSRLGRHWQFLGVAAAVARRGGACAQPGAAQCQTEGGHWAKCEACVHEGPSKSGCVGDRLDRTRVLDTSRRCR
jgi:hypothetical protein